MERRRFAQLAQALAMVTGRRTVLKGLGSLAALIPASTAARATGASPASPSLQHGNQLDARNAEASSGVDAATGLEAPLTQRKLIIAVRIYPYGKRFR